MPNYNVAVTLVALVEAPDEDAARQGVEQFIGSVTRGQHLALYGTDSFESEPLDEPPWLVVPRPGYPARPRSLT